MEGGARKRPCADPRASFATRLEEKWVRITAIVQVQIRVISPTPHDADSTGSRPGNVRKKSQVIPEYYSRSSALCWLHDAL